MAYQIEFSDDFDRQVRQFTARDCAIIMEAIEEQLVHQPDVATRKRVQLRKNPVADWELKIGNVRVFYNVYPQNEVVFIVAVGRKWHNRLSVEGEEVQL